MIAHPGSAADWLRRAHSDLSLARMPQPDGVLLEDLCFHAQQAAEKALKAVLVANLTPIPRTHNIGMLLSLIPSDLDLPQAVDDATILTDYAVASRYPGHYEPVDEDEHREAVALAEATVAWAQEQVEARTS
jgi:HEPN domain-containing protein